MNKQGRGDSGRRPAVGGRTAASRSEAKTGTRKRDQMLAGAVGSARKGHEERTDPAPGASGKPRISAEQVVAAVTELASPILESLGLELDRIEYVDRGSIAVLQVFVDRPGGISLEHVVRVTRELSPTLDVHDVVPKAYTLEVSSPGLDRPLVGENDFRRFAGRPASLVLRKAIEGGSKLVGRLRGVEAGQVLMERSDGRMVKVPLELVARARLEPEL